LRRFVAALGIVTLASLALALSGCALESGFSPAGAARQYIRALLAHDDAALDRLGEVSPEERAAVGAQAEVLLSGDVSGIEGGRLEFVAEGQYMLPVTVTAQDDSSATIEVTVDIRHRKVTAMNWADTP